MEWTARSNLVNVHKLAFKFKVQMFCKDEIKETLCAEFYTYVKKKDRFKLRYNDLKKNNHRCVCLHFLII